MSVPARVNVAIVGGGVIGASIAYHLAKAGAGDVALFERKTLTCGTTWHAAGLVGQLRATYNMTTLAKYSAELYCHLQEETGQATGFRQKGALNIADSDALMDEYRRAASMASRFGLAVEVLSPPQIKERAPMINTEGLRGGVYLPTDGQADPVGVTQALAAGAKSAGAMIFENTPISRLVTDKGRIVGVATAAGGEIAADVVVLAAGMWSRDIAAAVGVTLPLHACEHYYIVTEPIAGLSADMPVLRDVGARAYYKEDAGKILLGCFEKEARPWGENGIPDDFSFDSLPGDFEHFEPILEKAIHRLPLLETAGIQLFFCGPESFTPDDRYLIGEAPAVSGLYVACGMNSIGIQSAGGVGKVMAQWIGNKAAPMDLGDVDAARVMPFQRNRRYLRDRVRESLGTLYDVHFPHKQMTTARNARLSPLHQELAAAGACFGEVAGWERANWFAAPGQKAEYEYAYGRQNWFARCGEECAAAAGAAAVFDLSSFAKYTVRGADACCFLNRVCANQVDVAVGKIVYTPWLNERGGIEADLTVTRLAADDYLVVSGAPSQTRDMAWLRRQRRDGERVEIVDMTSAYANIGVFGPKAVAVLRAAGAHGADEAGIPFGESREVEVGYALVRALRLSYAGEAGFELLLPTEFALNAYRAIVEAGRDYGLKNGGMHAVDAMRMEKARRHFGDDITCEDTPLEAGLGFAVCWDKEFIGREALLAQKENAPLRKRLLQFKLSGGADAPLMFGEEPIRRDGKIVGGVTSGAYGHRLGASLALGYAHCDDGVSKAWRDSGQWEIEIAGERHAAEVCVRPPYDPDNAQLILDS